MFVDKHLSLGIIFLHKHAFISNCQRQSFFELPNRKWLSSRQPTFTISFYFSCRSIRCRIKGDWDRTNTLTAFLPVNANSWCQSQHESPGNIFETCWPCDCPLTAFLPVNANSWCRCQQHRIHPHILKIPQGRKLLLAESNNMTLDRIKNNVLGSEKWLSDVRNLRQKLKLTHKITHELDPDPYD